MGQRSTDEIAQCAFDLGLLDERQLQEVWASFGSRNVSIDDFGQVLVGRGFLTNYQLERLVKGERSGYYFGDYKALYLVGRGTFARVYRAAHRHTGRVVALKVLRSKFSDNPVQSSLFVREGRVGCALRHPNIVPIHDVYSKGRCHFLVMDFIEGRNLREFVRVRGKLDPAEATRLMIDITEGLNYAFQRSLSHRDLKMSNILVSSRGEAKLVDFGLASMDDTLTDDALAELPNTRTIDYAALERATGVRKDDTRSDIYFLGCIYYNMLAGNPPLAEPHNRTQRLSKQRFLDVVPIHKFDHSLPTCVAIAVNRAMMLDVGSRYQTPAAMLADLRSAQRRLAADAQASGDDAGPDRSAVVDTGRSIMVVEPNARMQDIFRNGFKQAGYRVLVTGDPVSAVNRFRQDAKLADCILLDAQELGQSALEAFNEIGEDQRTAEVPAMLLLDTTQRAWQSEARTAKHRVTVPMPITMKQLRATVAQLAPAKGN